MKRESLLVKWKLFGMRNNGIAEEKLKPQIQTQFDLTDAQMQELFK